MNKTIYERQIADLEAELRRQVARAERAEATLKQAREQEPVEWKVMGQYFKNADSAILFASFNKENGAIVEELYAAPKPTAPAVPEEWREVMAKLVGVVEASTRIHGCNALTKQARALLGAKP